MLRLERVGHGLEAAEALAVDGVGAAGQDAEGLLVLDGEVDEGGDGRAGAVAEDSAAAADDVGRAEADVVGARGRGLALGGELVEALRRREALDALGVGELLVGGAAGEVEVVAVDVVLDEEVRGMVAAERRDPLVRNGRSDETRPRLGEQRRRDRGGPLLRTRSLARRPPSPSRNTYVNRKSHNATALHGFCAMPQHPGRRPHASGPNRCPRQPDAPADDDALRGELKRSPRTPPDLLK